MPSKTKPAPRRAARIASGVFIVLLSILLVDMVMDIWPSVGVQSQACKQIDDMPSVARQPILEKFRKGREIYCRFRDVPLTRVNLEGLRMYLSQDQGLFGLVAMFAALGGLIRSLQSLASSAPGRSDGEISIGWNLLRPLVAALLAFIVYVVLRALFLPSGTLVAANPYGFIALAALVGLFCDELLCWARARGRSFLR